MGQIADIIQGTFNNLAGLNEDISLNRRKICVRCPIYSTNLGGQCNHNLWLNPDTEDVSVEAKEGYFRGCGCILNSKTRVPHAVCPAGKW